MIQTFAQLITDSGQSLPPIPKRSAVAHNAATNGPRLKGLRGVSARGPNVLATEELETIRTRTRHVVRNDPFAVSAVDRLQSNIVGSGIKAISKFPEIAEMWEAWAKRSDFDGRSDWYGQQSLAVRTMVESGEVLIRRRTVRRRGLRVPLQIEILEPDHLPTSFAKFSGVLDGNEVFNGVEVDPNGRRVAYHLYGQHPDEIRGAQDIVRIPAGQMLHMFKPLRPKQLRGWPWLTCVIATLDELSRYRDAELARKSIVASLTGFITQLNPGTSFFPQNSASETEIAAGTFVDLAPGEDVKLVETKDYAGGYVEFVRENLRAVAAGAGLTYEQLTGDLTGVNYSSIRAGLLEFRRKCEQIQYEVVCFQFCQPVFEWFLDAAVISGALKLRKYDEKFDEYADVRWVTPGWPWVDPKNDIEATVLAIDRGLTSRKAAVAETGETVERIDQENAEDKAREKAMGLEYKEKPAAPAPAAAAGKVKQKK